MSEAETAAITRMLHARAEALRTKDAALLAPIMRPKWSVTIWRRPW
jgi:hypothetical protein